jgi:short-subunit dehydrogenase
MFMNVHNSVAIVTGASSGIGLAVSKLLAQRGAKVVLVSRSKEKLEGISKSLPHSFAIVADMTKEGDIRKMVEMAKDRFGRIDILINNAGRGYDAPVEKINIDIFRHVFDLDVVGPIIAMQQVIPLMKSQGGGTIVNISSGTALMYLPNMGAYSCLKRALAAISLTAREELKSANIAVSVMYPYITLTEFEKNTIKDVVESDEEREGGPPFPPDTAEYVAETLLEGMASGEAEIFAHDWMKKMIR